MNSTKGFTFISEQITKYVEQHPSTQIAYEFDSVEQAHLIEVRPENERQSEDYTEWTTSVIRGAATEFPNELVVFPKSGDEYGVKSPTFIKTGCDFYKQIQARCQLYSFSLLARTKFSPETLHYEEFSEIRPLKTSHFTCIFNTAA